MQLIYTNEYGDDKLIYNEFNSEIMYSPNLVGTLTCFLELLQTIWGRIFIKYSFSFTVTNALRDKYSSFKQNLFFSLPINLEKNG